MGITQKFGEGKQLASGERVGVNHKVLTEDYLEYFYNYELIKSSVLEYGFETPDGFNSELLFLRRGLKFKDYRMAKDKVLPYGYQDMDDDIDIVSDALTGDF